MYDVDPIMLRVYISISDSLSISGNYIVYHEGEAGGVGADQLVDRAGHQPREPLPVLHRMVPLLVNT